MAYEDARAEREFRQNPPTDAPNQGGNNGWDDWDAMPTGSSSVESASSSYNSDINSTLSTPSNTNGTQGQNPIQSQMGNGMMNPQNPTATEDAILGVLLTILKLIWKVLKEFFLFSKDFIDSLKYHTKSDWHRTGEKMTLISGIVTAVGVIACFFNVFAKTNNHPLNLVITGLVGLIPGISMLMFCDLDPNEVRNQQGIQPQEEPTQSNNYDDDDEWNLPISSGGGDFEDEEYSSDGEDYEPSDDDWDSILADMGTGGGLGAGVDISSSGFDADETVNALPSITPGTQTRQYLYEAYMKILPIVSPDYATMKEISVDCDEFFDFETLLRDAAYQVGTKEENIPELMSLYENPFIYRLNCSRPAGMKEQQIADEIAKAFSRDNNNNLIRFGCYATVESANYCSINIFKGYTENMLGEQVGGVSISLGDVYQQIREFICSSQIEFPFVWGVNEKGKTLFCDMKDNNSIIICGEPRGGKSWKGQSIVAQLAMFHSPDEVQFYFLDNKDNASDYKYLSTVLPHAKYFCGDKDKINDSLEMIIDYMLNHNGKILAEAGCINIKDYNKEHPDSKLPYTYVVIDELQALMDYYISSGQKEEGARFRGYLSTMTSKLPYTGLRFILFPHRIVDQIISKNTYALVSCRAVVNQLDAKEVETAIGASESKFKYRLAQKGDMGIRLHELNGGEPCFCHAEILTTSNSSNKKLFKYIGSVWKKLVPESECIEIVGSIGGSIGGKRIQGSKPAPSTSSPKSNRPARDNTNGAEEFEYHGFNNGGGIDDMDYEGFEEFEADKAASEEEDFWSSIINSDEE